MIDYDSLSLSLEEMLQRSYEAMDPIQRDGVGKARKTNAIMFDVWMGVGKTFMGLTAGLCHKPQTWLIVGTKSSINSWKSELEQWYPEIASIPNVFTIVRGTAFERQRLYQQSSLFYATTSAALIRDIAWLTTKKVKFDVITCDEIHRLGLRNRKSEFFKALKALITHVEKKNKHPIKLKNFNSGTWSSKGVQQKWPVLHLCDPQLFRGYWPFVNMFCNVVTSGWGGSREIIGPKNTAGFARAIHPYVYTVTEDEAKKKLPELRRARLYTEFTPELLERYRTLEEHMFMELDSGDVFSVTTLLAVTVRLRQFVCCPALIAPELGPGVAISAVCEKIEESERLHNIIFVPFIDAIPIFRDYISTQLSIPKEKILIMQGGMEPEEVHAVEQQFRNDPQTMVLCSTRFSESFNLETAVACYHTHFDWDQDINKQAEARARRASGKQEFIMSYYVGVYQSITEEMFTLMNHKEHINKIPYDAIRKLKESLKARHPKNNLGDP